MAGQADDLGGGVWKKRLGKNLYRAIVVTRGNDCWIYEYVFAKNVLANIEQGDLAGFRKLAKSYSALRVDEISDLVERGFWMEICDDQETKIS